MFLGCQNDQVLFAKRDITAGDPLGINFNELNMKPEISKKNIVIIEITINFAMIFFIKFNQAQTYFYILLTKIYLVYFFQDNICQ